MSTSTGSTTPSSSTRRTPDHYVGYVDTDHRLRQGVYARTLLRPSSSSPTLDVSSAWPFYVPIDSYFGAAGPDEELEEAGRRLPLTWPAGRFVSQLDTVVGRLIPQPVLVDYELGGEPWPPGVARGAPPPSSATWASTVNAAKCITGDSVGPATRPQAAIARLRAAKRRWPLPAAAKPPTAVNWGHIQQLPEENPARRRARAKAKAGSKALRRRLTYARSHSRAKAAAANPGAGDPALVQAAQPPPPILDPRHLGPLPSDLLPAARWRGRARGLGIQARLEPVHSSDSGRGRKVARLTSPRLLPGQTTALPTVGFAQLDFGVSPICSPTPDLRTPLPWPAQQEQSGTSRPSAPPPFTATGVGHGKRQREELLRQTTGLNIRTTEWWYKPDVRPAAAAPPPPGTTSSTPPRPSSSPPGSSTPTAPSSSSASCSSPAGSSGSGRQYEASIRPLPPPPKLSGGVPPAPSPRLGQPVLQLNPTGADSVPGRLRVSANLYRTPSLPPPGLLLPLRLEPALVPQPATTPPPSTWTGWPAVPPPPPRPPA